MGGEGGGRWIFFAEGVGEERRRGGGLFFRSGEPHSLGLAPGGRERGTEGKEERERDGGGERYVYIEVEGERVRGGETESARGRERES